MEVHYTIVGQSEVVDVGQAVAPHANCFYQHGAADFPRRRPPAHRERPNRGGYRAFRSAIQRSLASVQDGLIAPAQQVGGLSDCSALASP